MARGGAFGQIGAGYDAGVEYVGGQAQQVLQTRTGACKFNCRCSSSRVRTFRIQFGGNIGAVGCKAGACTSRVVGGRTLG